MKPVPCIVIARVTDTRMWSPTVELFLPFDIVNYGNISCWDGCHSEASLDYYRKTKPPRTRIEREAAAARVQRYRELARATCGEEIVERVRLPRGWRDHAWK
jgi:hypothetical protein